MSEGATMSAPASPCASAERAISSSERSLSMKPGWPGSRDAAVAVAGVLAQARVGDQHERRRRTPDRPQSLLDDAVRRPGFRPFPVFSVRQPEQQHGRDAKVGHFAGVFDEPIDRLMKDTGHRGNLLVHVAAGHDKDRIDQAIDVESRLAHHAPQVFGAAQSARVAPPGIELSRGVHDRSGSPSA